MSDSSPARPVRGGPGRADRAPHSTSREAYETLATDAEAVLVDVRTPEEWTYVGGPDLRHLGKPVVRIPWQDVRGRPNPDFVAQLQEAGIDDDQPVLFLCRSGSRSQAAADRALAEGYHGARNVSDGFEGPVDPDGHRGTVSGWKAAALPWRQQ